MFQRISTHQRVRLQPKDQRAKQEAVVIVLANETAVAWISNMGLTYPKNMWQQEWKKSFKPH
jgi:hypothetical protein